MKLFTLMMSTALCLMSFALNAENKMVRVEEALELSSLNIRLDASLNGRIEGKMCEQCKTINVVVTPDTLAMEDHKAVPLIEVKKRAGKPALVIFDPKTLKAKTISWKAKN